MHWRIKAIIQSALAYMPQGERLHFHLQRTFGGLRNFERELNTKVEDWHIMAGHLRDAGVSIHGLRMLEVGSGWYPTLPFAYYLGGAGRVVTIDLNRHMRPDLTRMCAERLGNHLALIAEACGATEDDVRRRHHRLVSDLVGNDVQAATGGVVEYHAPGDATRSKLADHSIDVVFSNSVLEHVPPAVVDALYRESRRILADRGIMFHSVNCGDHYAYVDRTISQLNYLRYSDEDWRRWNNDFLYQNRMRADEFVTRARLAGFDVELDTAKPNERRLKELKSVPVHPQFAGIPAERLCITSVDFIARQTVKAVTATDAASAPGTGRQFG